MQSIVAGVQYRPSVTPVKVLSFGKSPYTQTRYRFNHGTTT